MQVTLTFDTEETTAAKIYQLLVDGNQAQLPLPVAKPQKAAPAPAAKPAAKSKTPVTDVLGPANGQDQEDQTDDDMGMVPPSLSPGEAKDQALALVREAYAAGHVAEVKALQKEWGVAKFYDVPVEKGNEFYQRVMKLAVGVGIRQ